MSILEVIGAFVLFFVLVSAILWCGGYLKVTLSKEP